MSNESPDGIGEIVRWRNEQGRVVGGHLTADQDDEAVYTVAIPNWIDGTVQFIKVPRSGCVVGNVPWPDWM